jgi:hypothetical protein
LYVYVLLSTDGAAGDGSGLPPGDGSAVAVGDGSRLAAGGGLILPQAVKNKQNTIRKPNTADGKLFFMLFLQKDKGI